MLHVLEANGSAVIPVLWTCKHRCTKRVLHRRLRHKALTRCAARLVDNYGAPRADPEMSTPKRRTLRMTMNHTSAVLAQLRTALDLTDAEMQVAETRVQARTDAVRSRLGR